MQIFHIFLNDFLIELFFGEFSNLFSFTWKERLSSMFMPQNDLLNLNKKIFLQLRKNFNQAKSQVPSKIISTTLWEKHRHGNQLTLSLWPLSIMFSCSSLYIFRYLPSASSLLLSVSSFSFLDVSCSCLRSSIISFSSNRLCVWLFTFLSFFEILLIWHSSY